MSSLVAKAPGGFCLLCGESGSTFLWSLRELGAGGGFLAAITVLMDKEMSGVTDAQRSLVPFELGLNQN